MISLNSLFLLCLQTLLLFTLLLNINLSSLSTKDKHFLSSSFCFGLVPPHCPSSRFMSSFFSVYFSHLSLFVVTIHIIYTSMHTHIGVTHILIQECFPTFLYLFNYFNVLKKTYIYLSSN